MLLHKDVPCSCHLLKAPAGPEYESFGPGGQRGPWLPNMFFLFSDNSET
jgi:hypothetical protein